uniref:RING-type E3 ubiquitin transferase n=1 Tax=Globodera pallida TaxID=36090 RepID=A0A183C9R8_GLOPA
MEVDEQLGTDDVDILQSNLEYAFGVSIDDNSGIAQQFTSSPESLLQLQGLVRAALSSMSGKDVIDHSLLLDELILLAVNMIKSGDGSVANADDALSTLLPQFGLALSPVASSALDYLVGLRNRCDFLLAKSKDVAKCVMILNLLERRIMVQLVLFFRGLLSERCSYENVSAVFLERLLSEEIDTFFVHQLILCCRDSSLVDSAALVEVFNPILTLMRALILSATAEQKYNEIVEKIFMTLKQLLEVKLGDNTRPIAELDLCFENASDAFSNAKLSETEKEQLMTTHRVWLGNLRINLHVVVHALVVNGSTRLQTLDYIGHLLATNRKLSQLQADFSQLANCTSVLNLFCVLLSLSEKIVTEKFMRISLIAMMNAHSRLRRFYIGDVRRRVQEMEERLKSLGVSANAAQKSRIQSALNKANEMVKQFTVSADCYQCLLNEPEFDRKQNFEPSFDRFYSFPESYLEVAVEFLNFLLSNSKMARIFLKNLSDFPKQLLHLLLNLENIKNPFIASKVADLLFMLCPMVNQEASGFYRQIVTDPLAVEGLFPSLVKFYSAVETTGSHTEFFDKFNIRRNIQVIFKCMWSDLSHRDRMVQYAGESSPSFVRFINMVLNDTTFLLDESLDKLKMIHDIEAILSRETEWNKLSQDEQQRKTEQLRDSKSQVKMWIQLGSDTMELFVTLTNDAPEIFRNEALGERVAAMLNHNLVQLCGPKCAQLKVHDAISRFEWDPRTLTQQIVMVYINLGSTMFAEQIAQDERSYTPETFATILERFKTRNILTVNHLELFTHLAEQAEAAYKEKMLFEEEFEDEIPEEFKDALVYTLMSDPLLLPSGQICDRKNILRHLLSDPTNPFTRQPLTTDELKPADDLKTRIKGWVQEKRNSRNVEKGN